MKFTNLLTEQINNIIAYHGTPYNFDQFEFDKIGSGDGKDKYGFGLYFASKEDVAADYAKDLTLAKHRDGFNIFKVRLSTNNLIGWDDQIDYTLYENIIEYFDNNDMQDEIEEFKDAQMEGGYEMWTGRELYDWLQYTIDGGRKGASVFLRDEMGVDGFYVTSYFKGGIVYVIFDDSIIKILSKEKIK